MEIPEKHKRTIRRLVSRNKAVAQATCDIPHIPGAWLRKGNEDEPPYCGCFVGTYAWMQECAKGKEILAWDDMPRIVADHTGISEDSIQNLGTWCITKTKDRLAVEYTRELLANA